MSNYKTEQEKFWAEEFGTNYIDRNKSAQLVASNLNFFTMALKRAAKITSCIEFGANIGINLQVLKLLYPGIKLKGIEINKQASDELEKLIGSENVFNGSIFDSPFTEKVDLVLTKGILIHTNPEVLNKMYEKLNEVAGRYILMGEYYNPSPVTIPYRGHDGQLFKRDFAGEFLEKFPDTELRDYGFCYRKDPVFPQDDITWFLLEKIRK